MNTKIRRLLDNHQAYRDRSLNLIASENSISPTVAGALVNDLIGRYADYSGRDLSARRYKGNQYIIDLEKEAADIARRVLGAEHVELRPLGGHLAGVAVLAALCRPGDVVFELGRDGGGHRLAGRMAGTAFDVTPTYLPFDGKRFNVDLDQTLRMIRREHPALVILGSSSFLFPHPVQEISEAVSDIEGTFLAYDASHVMGFLAAGQFQDPLAEGADIVFGSTHKTLPGPQGGVIMSTDGTLIERVADALTPSLVTNHHAFRIPALALALLEMERWGPTLFERTVRNSNALGRALEDAEVPCVRVDNEYSRSHAVLVAVESFGGGEVVADLLEEAGVITNSTRLPDEWGREGIRLGTQEVTRRGADEGFMAAVADVFAGILHQRRPMEQSARMVRELAFSLGEVGYTWPDETKTGGE